MSEMACQVCGAAASAKRKKPFKLIKTSIVAVAIFGLLALNVLTLVSDVVQGVCVTALEWGMRHMLPTATASRLLTEMPAKKYAVLKTENRALEMRHAELKRVSAMRADTVKSVSRRISLRAARNAATNLGGLGLEATPVVGVAAIAAITASDLYDDCQTMKDVNELNVAFGHDKADEGTICGMKVPQLPW